MKCASKNKVGHDGQQITPMLSPPVGKTPPKQSTGQGGEIKETDKQPAESVTVT